MDLLHSTLVDALNDAVEKKPSAVAFSFFDDNIAISITYLELVTRAHATAAAIKSTTMAGDRVALLFPAGIDFIIAFFGCLYAEVIAIPIEPPENASTMLTLQQIIESSSPSLCLSTTPVFEKLRKLRASIRVQQIPVLNKLVRIFGNEKFDNASPRSHLDLKKLTWLITDKIDSAHSVRYQPCEIYPRTVAVLHYTSNASRQMKGVLLTHGNITHNLEMNRVDTGISASDICVSWLSPFHSKGLILGILQPIYSQIPVYLMLPSAFIERPNRWLAAITKFKATISGAPAFAFQRCIDAITQEEKKMLDLSGWKLAFFSGELVSSNIFENFYEAFKGCGFRKEIFYPIYGLTNATCYVFGSTRNQGALVNYVDKDALSLKRIIQRSSQVATAQPLLSYRNNMNFQQVKIINPATLTECADGEIGEIWLQSPSVAAGYWQLPEETKKTFHNFINKEGPFLCTGDLGCMQGNQILITEVDKEVLQQESMAAFSDLKKPLPVSANKKQKEQKANVSISTIPKFKPFVPAKTLHPEKKTSEPLASVSVAVHSAIDSDSDTKGRTSLQDHDSAIIGYSRKSNWYNLMYQLQPLPPVDNTVKSETWLIFSGVEGFAVSIQKQVAVRNIHVIEARFDRDFNPENKAHILAILQGHSRVNKIIYCSGEEYVSELALSPSQMLNHLGLSAGYNSTYELPEAQQAPLNNLDKFPTSIEKNTLKLLLFFKAIFRVEFSDNPTLVVITKGACPFRFDRVDSTSLEDNTLVQTTMIDVFNTFISEQPQWRCQHIDLDSSTSFIENAQRVSDEMLSTRQELQCVYRQNNRYIVQLVKKVDHAKE